MTNQEIKDQQLQLTQIIQETKKKMNILSLLRLLFMIGVIADLFIGYFQKKEILYLLAFVCLILFMILVVIHKRIQKQFLYHQALLDVYQEHLLRKEGQWDQFLEDGLSFVEDKDYRSLDLDVFGHHSLFQFINIAFTNKGKARLAHYLKPHDETSETLKERQQAIQELTKHSEFVLKTQTFGRLIQKNKEKIIQDFILSTKGNKTNKVSYFFMVIPFLFIVLLGCVLLSIGKPYTMAALEMIVFIQIAIGFLFMIKHNVMFDPLSQLSMSLRSYQSIFELIQEVLFQSPLLLKIQKETLSNDQAVQGIKELSALADRVSYRKNIIAFIILNGLGLYDFWMRNQYINWLNQYQDSIEQWLDGLAELEALMSLSVLKIDDYDVHMPVIETNQCLSFTHLRHPLIPQGKVVGNDFKMNQNVHIITGSNMSGKTTFMRTIGLNLVLSYAGGYVFAKEMKCSIMSVFTSMRIQDNVEEGISTFYGELLRVKEMIDYSKQQIPMICFIDEIFKGTNSLDRIAGAKATLEQLSIPHCITFLTTHDFELCEMDTVDFDNYHFDEYYEDQQIYFDYHIKDGKSKSTNGQFLLKQLGIMKEK